MYLDDLSFYFTSSVQPLARTEEWLQLIMSNQSKEGHCKRINTLVKLPKLQSSRFRQFRLNHTDS